MNTFIFFLLYEVYFCMILTRKQMYDFLLQTLYIYDAIDEYSRETATVSSWCIVYNA